MARKKTSIKSTDSIQNEKAVNKERESVIDYKIKLSCKNNRQKDFVNSLKDNSKEICFGVGAAGTGKTYLSLATSLKLLITESERFKKIFIFVNPCESTHSLSIGFLKGTYEEKIEPYIQNALNNIRKILEASGNTDCDCLLGNLITKGIINFEIINYVKGKTFENCICLVEEAEDLSKDDILLLLTRKGGHDCKFVINGDDKQISRTDIRKNKSIEGLNYAARVLSPLDEVAVTEFTNDDIVRDKLITKIIELFSKNDGDTIN